MAEVFEFNEINNLKSQNYCTGGRSEGVGCRLSLVKGFILVFLALLIAVVVGLIVHFAGSNTKECSFRFPNDLSLSGELSTAKGNAKSTLTVHPPTTSNPTEKCERLAAEGNTRICHACPGTERPTPTTAVSPAIPVDIRLPTDIVPVTYEVKLRPNMYGPDPTTFNFTGSVKIRIQCKKSTENVILHINGLNVTEKSIKVYGSGMNFSVNTERDSRRQFLILKLNQHLMADHQYYVSMDFVGLLENGLNGLYLSSYERGNETLYLTSSFFAPTEARKAFPCFDEPALKANFAVTLERKSNLVALSNMPLLRSENTEDDWVADLFETTPKMSTYLLAFIVCDFDYAEGNTARNVTYRAWARPEAKIQTEYGLSVGVKVLTFFEDYFNIPYPLPKQDMIALPDFSAGAMENWGLITYRETTMLFDPNQSSKGDKQQVATVIAHELAHQWFGNLVTPAWWDDIWLNEGFASYMEYLGVVQVEADWKMFEQFVLHDLHRAFGFDDLVSSHPLFAPVAGPAEINEIFDVISYLKGASVIRMAKFFLGDETFRKGLINYLRGLAYGSATHNDLWYAWGNQSLVDGNDRTDVKEIMDTWILQMNFPVVSIKRTTNGMSVKQERFLLDSTAPDPGKYTSPFGYKWDIPFTYTHEDEKNFESTGIHWMERGDLNVVDSTLPGTTDNKWVLANINQYGYYRVNYEERNWQELIRQLEDDHTVIPTINRAQILNDAWNLARAGLLDMVIALDTTNYLKKDRDYVPWAAALKELHFVHTMLQRHELYGEFKKFMTSTVEHYFDELTMNNTGATHIESYRRSQISSEACTYGVQSCINEAKTRYKQWMVNSTLNLIDPGLRYTVYCTAIHHGGTEEWDFAYEQQKISNVAAEMSRIRSAMACSSQTWILQRYLQKTLITEEIRKQDAVDTIVAISRNTIGRTLAWDFIGANWDYFTKEYAGGVFSFSSLISGTTSALNTEFDLQQLHEFKEKFPDMGSGTRAFDQAMERTKSNIYWMKNNVPVIKRWLSAKNL